MARHAELHGRIARLEYGRITQITGRAWVRRNPGRQGHWEVPGPEGLMVPLESWDIWFDRVPGDPPRDPDVVQPGSTLGPTGRIWTHHCSKSGGA
jgi:hypothetical protein